MIPANIWINFSSPETTEIVLTEAETARSYSYLDKTPEREGMTDGRTDGNGLASTALGIASNADAL